MRKAMLSRSDLDAAVFIGGMEGVIEERGASFAEFHPKGRILAVSSPGGAARQLAEELGVRQERDLQQMSISRPCFIQNSEFAQTKRGIRGSEQGRLKWRGACFSVFTTRVTYSGCRDRWSVIAQVTKDDESALDSGTPRLGRPSKRRTSQPFKSGSTSK